MLPELGILPLVRVYYFESRITLLKFRLGCGMKFSGGDSGSRFPTRASYQ